MKAPLRFVVALVCGVLFFTSCMRDEDMELLRHPIHVQGTIDPTLGIPIGYGEVTIHDVLKMINEDYSGYLDTLGDIVTISYRDSFDGKLQGSNGKKHTKARKMAPKGGVLWSKDTTITFSLPIDYFDKIDEYLGDTTEIYFNDMIMNIDAQGIGHAAPEAVETLRRYVSAQVDSLRLKYTDHQNVIHAYRNNEIESLSLDINDVVQGANANWNDLDLSDIANNLPKRIDISFRLRVLVDRAILLPDPETMTMEDLMDSLQLASLDYHIGLDVQFPCNFSFKKMPYTVDLDLGEGLKNFNFDSIINSIGEGFNSELEESTLNLEFNNGLPLGMIINADVVDAAGNVLFKLINGAEITAAEATHLFQPGIYTTSKSNKSVVSVALDGDKLTMMRNAKTIHLRALISSTGNPAAGETVAITKDDFLGIRAYILLDPKISIDIPVTESGLIK